MQETKGLIQKAIRLHEKHMNDPKTATMVSQKVLMEQLKAIQKSLSHESMEERMAGKNF